MKIQKKMRFPDFHALINNFSLRDFTHVSIAIG